MSRTIPAVLLSALLLPSAGCFSLFADEIDPIYKIADRSYVVVFPIKEPDFRTGWDSPNGHDLAELVTQILAARVDFRVTSYDSVVGLMWAPPAQATLGIGMDEGPAGDERVGLDVRTVGPRQLADFVGADYVIYCELTRFQLRDPLNINMSRASGQADVKLFKVARTQGEREHAQDERARRGEMERARARAGLGPVGFNPHGGTFVAQSTVSANYPVDYFAAEYGDVFGNQAELHAGLLSQLARKIAQLFYAHEPEKVPGSGS